MKKSLRATVVSSSHWILTAATVATLVGGCVQEPAPFDPRAAQQWERAQDNQIKPRPMYPLPTTEQTQYEPGSNVIRPIPPGQGVPNVPEGIPVKMSLQEIVHRAIVNSLDIRVASYDTAVDQTRVMEAEAAFDPSVFANVNFERVNKESAGIITDFDPVFNSATHVALFNQSDTTNVQFGMQEKTQTGADVKLSYTVQNIWSNPQQTPINPYYENDLELQVTQPLLQNFGLDVNQARITISRNNQRISLLDWRKTVEDSVLQIEKTYWQLVQAQRDVKTLERLVEASEDTTKTLWGRQQQDVTSVQVQQSNAATATRKVQLVAARAHVADLSDQLKRLMDDPNFPVSGAALIVPANDDTDVPLHFDLDDMINTGLENRLDLGQQQVRIESSETAITVARNNLLPQLNFQGTVTSDGIGRDAETAFNQQGDFGHIGYYLGFQFQYPLGNRAARAIWQRALLQREQALESYRQLVEQVALDVKQAARQVDTSWAQLGVARNARFLEEQTLSGLQKQQNNAVELTPEFVQLKLDTQDRLGAAEQAEHQAMNDYNFAIANLEKAKGTILRYNNVILEEKDLPFDMELKAPTTSHGGGLTVQPAVPSLVGVPAK